MTFIVFHLVPLKDSLNSTQNIHTPILILFRYIMLDKLLNSFTVFDQIRQFWIEILPLRQSFRPMNFVQVSSILRSTSER